MLVFAVFAGIADSREYFALFDGDPGLSAFLDEDELNEMNMLMEQGIMSEEDFEFGETISAAERRYGFVLGLQTFFMFAGLAALIAGVNRIADHLTQKKSV